MSKDIPIGIFHTRITNGLAMQDGTQCNCAQQEQEACIAHCGSVDIDLM